LSQSDSFIEEVSDEVRRDKLFATFRRYGWIAAILVVLIVGGAAWYEYRRAQDTATAEAYGDALLTALEQGEPAERATALDAIAVDSADAGALRDLMRAGELAEADDTDAAADVLNGVANEAGVPVIYRSIAKFRALALQAGTMPPEERRAGYEELSGVGNPLRLMAMEQIAMTYVEEGNSEEALNRLKAIQDEAGVTPDLLRRVSQLIVALGGDPDPAAETDAATSEG